MSDLELRDITDDSELCLEVSKQTFNTWGHPLDLDQYLAFGKQVSKVFEEGKYPFTQYALFKGNDIVSSCEVLERPLYLGNGEFGKDYVVATVFTPPKFRQQGYAQHMLDLVVPKYTKDDGKSQCSLWSDVGRYYERFGFRYLPKFEENLTLILPPQQYKADSSIELLTRPQIPKLIDLHKQRLFEYVDQHKGVIVPPEFAMYESLQMRVNLQQQILNQPLSKYFGAQNVNTGSWIAWTYLVNYKKAFVLGLDGPVTELASLLAVACNECAELDLSLELFDTTLMPDSTNLDALVSEIKNLGLNASIETRAKSQPMSTNPNWIGAGGYAWY